AATMQVVVTSSLSRAARRQSDASGSQKAHGQLSEGLWEHFLKGLILAQNERWRRGLGMQVERIPEGLLLGESGERGSKAWVTYPGDVDSPPNGGVIHGDLDGRHLLIRK